MSTGAGAAGGLEAGSKGINQILKLILASNQQKNARQEAETDAELRRELLNFQQEQAASQANFQAQQLSAGLAQSKADQDLERRRFELEQRVTEAKLAAFLRDAQAAEDKANGGDGGAGDGAGTPAVFGGPGPTDENTGTFGRVINAAQQGLAAAGQGFGKDIFNAFINTGGDPEELVNASGPQILGHVGAQLGENLGLDPAGLGENAEFFDVPAGVLQKLIGFPTEAPGGIIKRRAVITGADGSVNIFDDISDVSKVQAAVLDTELDPDKRNAKIRSILGLPKDFQFEVNVQQSGGGLGSKIVR